MPTMADWAAAVALRDGVLLQTMLLTAALLLVWRIISSDMPARYRQWVVTPAKVAWIVLLLVSVVNVLWTKI